MKAVNLWLSLSLVLGAGFARAGERGLVNDPHVSNEALIVNVGNGLPGGRSNVVHMTEIVSDPHYQFHVATLEDYQGTASAILAKLKETSAKVPANGTLLFYFAGHGGNQIVLASDRNFSTSEIRAAIEEGRKSAGPLSRLVFIVDACESGSHIGPMGRSLTADSLAETLMRGERSSPFWDKLIVMTSSQANELSWVDSNGHMFTTAVYKAFPKSLDAHETIGEFFTRASQGLTASHPTYKVIPEDLMHELLAP